MNSNKIVVTPIPVCENGISAFQLAVGDAGRIVVGSNEGTIVLRIDDGLVNLNTNTFIPNDVPAFAVPRVKSLNAGDQITITIGVSESFIEEVKNELRFSNKINAIKMVRDRLGWRLRESKEFVDKLEGPKLVQPAPATGEVVRY